MTEIFRIAIERGASDIHIKSGAVIRARIHGRLVTISDQKMSTEQVRELARRLIPHEKDRDRLDEILDYDCSWGLPGLGRFRVNILRQRGSWMIVMRVIPFEVPTFADLSLPKVFETIAETERGLVLVTGATGTGKSSTMAALINHINEHQRKHVVTLENPIEFLHRDKQSSITQRDIGTDTESFVDGLRAALRQDPDVIMIGEMRDAETIATALKAAETGHLVVSTLHTQNAPQTITRLVASFPLSEQGIIRLRLAESLTAVASQRLLPRKDGKGRAVACEIMMVTGTIQECILDPGRLEDMSEFIEEGRSQYGSQTFDQHLMDLVHDGVVDYQVAKLAASSPSDFELKMNVFAGEVDGGSGSTVSLSDEMVNLFGT